MVSHNLIKWNEKSIKFDANGRIVYNSEYCGNAGKRFVIIIQFDKMGEYK